MSHSLSTMIGIQNTSTAMSDSISTGSSQLVFLQIKFHVMEATMGLHAVTVVPEGEPSSWQPLPKLVSRLF